MAFYDRSVSRRIALLFNTDDFADIHFNVEGQRIPCHTIIVGTASSVLRHLCEDNVEEVFVDDTVSIFTDLLRYIYTDEIDINVDNVFGLMVAARKYGLPSLEEHCIDFRIKQLDPDNAFMILLQGRNFNQQKLIKECFNVIDDNSNEAFNSDGFLDVDKLTVISAIMRDRLTIKEIDLFNAVMRWCDAECVRRKLPIDTKLKKEILGDIIYFIRFPLMSIEDFGQKVLPCNVLSNDDASAVFNFLCGNGEILNFNSSLRRAPGYKFVVARFQNIGSKWTYFGGYDKIGFTVDRGVHLLGVGLYAIRKTYHNYKLSVNVSESPDHLLYRSTFENIKCDWEEEIFHFYFDRPVKLRPNTVFIISVKIKEGPASLCGLDGLKKVRTELPAGDSITVTFSKVKETSSRPSQIVRTNVHRGQIPELIFSL